MPHQGFGHDPVLLARVVLQGCPPRTTANLGVAVMEKVKVVMESLNLEPCLQGTDGTIFSDLPLYEQGVLVHLHQEGAPWTLPWNLAS